MTFKFRPDQYPDNAIHISIDLETASTADNAAVVQIAATVVGCQQSLVSGFDQKISLCSCEQHGMVIDPETMKWWDTQDEEVRKRVFSGTDHIQTGINNFISYCEDLCGGDWNRIYLWGNGADFDCTILRNACEVFRKWPINFRNHEHLRTLKRSMPIQWQQVAHELFMDLHGQVARPHDAMWDAIYQAYIIQHGLEYQKQCVALMEEFTTGREPTGSSDH